MSDWESICSYVTNEENELIKRHFVNPEDLYTEKMIEEYKSTPIREKINQQPPLVQKYWLGRLVYEFAIRNENVQRTIKLRDVVSIYIYK